MELPNSKLLCKEAIRIFDPLFSGFRVTTILYRETPRGYTVNVSFVYTELDIPRSGILVYDVQKNPIKVSFNPFASQPRPEAPCGIDYIKLLFVDARHELYALEPLLNAAFLQKEFEPIASADEPN